MNNWKNAESWKVVITGTCTPASSVTVFRWSKPLTTKIGFITFNRVPVGIYPSLSPWSFSFPTFGSRGYTIRFTSLEFYQTRSPITRPKKIRSNKIFRTGHDFIKYFFSLKLSVGTVRHITIIHKEDYHQSARIKTNMILVLERYPRKACTNTGIASWIQESFLRM